jgi:hypothetical protein
MSIIGRCYYCTGYGRVTQYVKPDPFDPVDMFSRHVDIDFTIPTMRTEVVDCTWCGGSGASPLEYEDARELLIGLCVREVLTDWQSAVQYRVKHAGI